MQNTLGEPSSFITRKTLSLPPNKLLSERFLNTWLALRNHPANQKKEHHTSELFGAYIYEKKMSRIQISPPSTFSLLIFSAIIFRLSIHCPI